MSSKRMAGMLLVIGSAAWAAAVMAGEPATTAKDASIPFANHNGIYNWTADGDHAIWVQDVHKKWFYAKLIGPCTGLDFAEAVGFDTRPNGTLDRFGGIVFRGPGSMTQTCRFASFEPSSGPPKKVARHKIDQPAKPAAEQPK